MRIRHLLLRLIVAAIAVTPLVAQDGPPPLLDRELFFGEPKIAGSQLSPDGRYHSFLKETDGVMNIWVRELSQPMERARQLTGAERSIPGYFWSEDGRYILYVQDKGGDENYHVHAVEVAAKPGRGSSYPSSRDLTPVEGVRAQIYGTVRTKPNILLVGLNDRDPRWHDLYSVDITTGKRTLLRKNTENVLAWITDDNGTLRIAYSMDPATGDQKILKVGKKGELETLYSCGVFESCAPVHLSRDGSRLYIETNKGEQRDLTELVLLDLVKGGERLVERDPQGHVDFGAAIFSEVTDSLLATSYTDERVRVVPRDSRFAADLDLLRRLLPAGEIAIQSTTRDEQLALVNVGSATNPGAVYLFDRKSGKVEKLYDVRPEVPTEHLVEMQPLGYPTRDGLQIPGYITFPKGVELRNLPAVIFIHGGPWARDMYGYSAGVQFLANRGYLVLQPNFRGSTGYGKRFLNAGNGEWGTGAMQHDISDAVAYLTKKGIADPKRVAIMGGSYGGYATLAGLAFTPELYAAGVDIVGPSNLFTLLGSIPPYWAPLKRTFDLRLGDPTVAADSTRLFAQSPLFFADRIKAPLLVIQGANDPRVRKQEADQIVRALRDRGAEVSYLLAPDEGHGFQGELNNLAMWAAVERFLGEELGGRVQESISDSVAARLRELTVDIASLGDAPVGETVASDAPLPLPTREPALGSRTYTVTYTVQGSTIPMTAIVKAEKTSDAWRVVQTVTSPMGKIVDEELLALDTWQPKRRTMTSAQGGAELTFEGGHVRGTMDQGTGTKIPFDVPLSAPLYSNGPGFDYILAGLPLADGYTTTLRLLDPMQQRAQTLRFRIDGEEKVMVPAGSYETWRVRATNTADGSDAGTYWVTRSAPFMVVRKVEHAPESGGVTVTTELATK